MKWGGGAVVEILRCVLAVASVMLASDSILVVSEWCDAFLGRAACLGLVALSWREWRGAGRTGPGLRLALAAVAAGSAWLSFTPDHSALRMILVAWVVGFMWLGEVGIGGARRWPRGEAQGAGLACLLPVHLAALAYAMALGACERSAAVWLAWREVGGWAGHCVGGWVAGLPICGFGLLALVTIAGAGEVRRAHAAWCGALVAGFAGIEIFLSLKAPLTAVTVSACHLGGVGLVAAVVTGAARASGAASRGAAGPSCAADSLSRAAAGRRSIRIPAPRLPVYAISIGLTVAGLVTIWLPAPPPSFRQPAEGHRRPSVLLYSRGFLDWKVPGFDQVGLVNSGMFGLFRRALEREAFGSSGSVTEIEGGIRADDLAGVGLVVVINPTGGLGQADGQVLEEFVRAGGGLLVLGDHTNIGGSMHRLNSILAFTGIRFNFDSAVPMRSHWRGCLEVRRHPVTASAWRGSRRRCPPEELLQVAVGASLAVTAPALPLVVGRYGFADAGDSLNGGAGAYIGDLARGRGEAVGDVVLVAAEEVGRGRVLVFGDTSPFQNGALFLSQRLVCDAVEWVAPGVRRPRNHSGSGALRYADEMALIDFSLRPRASVSLFTETSLGGLANCLARVGVSAVPAFSRADWDSAARYLFLVAPTRLGRDDADALLGYAGQGGNVILAQGYASSQPCAGLLSRLGLAIEDIPLGNGDPAAGIGHKDAWAIRLADSDTIASHSKVLARAFGYPTAITVPVGRGSVTLLSDSRLLLDENLEGEWRAERRNISFVSRLIEQFRKGSEAGHADAP
jgi:hypothetical protein